MHFMTFSKSEIILVTKFMGSACLRGLHILFLGVFPRPISSDNSVSIYSFISVTNLQEVLQLAQEFFPLGGVGELEDEVVVLDDADEDHGLLLGVLRDLDGQVLHPLHVNAPQLLPLN